MTTSLTAPGVTSPLLRCGELAEEAVGAGRSRVVVEPDGEDQDDRTDD